MRNMFCTGLSILLAAVSLPGCFMKSDKTGSADDIHLSFIYSGRDLSCLVTLETVFHATSKSSGGGMTRISGHATYRISTYGIGDGKLVSRAVLGEANDDRPLLLGVTEGNIWMYSLDRDLGLHSRDPKTLEVKVTQDEILRKNPSLSGNLLRPKYYELSRYFGWDDSASAIVVTGVDGRTLALDPATFASRPYSGRIEQQISENNSLDGFSTTGTLPVPSRLRTTATAKHENIQERYTRSSLEMKGGMRKQPAMNDSVLAGDKDYLNGEFITDAAAATAGLHNAVLTSGSPGTAFITHDESAGETQKKFISKITLQGRTFHEDWRQAVASGSNERVGSIFSYDTALIVVTRTYHETSSRTMGGKQSYIRFSDGYGVYQYTAYSMNTGAVLGKFAAEDRNGMTEYIGRTDGALWFRSYDPALALHARDPVTLKVKVTGAQIREANPGEKNWAKDSPSYIAYRCGILDGRVMLEDRSGYCHQLDPVTLKITASELRQFQTYSGGSTSSQSAYIYTPKAGMGDPGEDADPLNISMNGDIRKKIETGSGKDEVRSTEEFIDGRLLMDWGGPYPLATGRWLQSGSHSSDHRVLHSGPVCYAIAGSTLSDTARATVTAMEFTGTGFTKKWSTELGNIFYHPDKAISVSGMEKVFSSGNPSYRYSWAGMLSGKIIIISMLHAICIDAVTGKVVWQMEF